MSSPCCTLSPHEHCLAKTKAPKEHMEEEWGLISEGELDPMLSDDKKMAEMQDQEKRWRVEEATEREEAAKRAVEAVEERADAKRRAVKECLWEVVGQRSETAVAPPWVAKPSRRMMVAGPSAPGHRVSGVQDPCTRCHNKGTPCVLGAAKGKTTACEVCRHAKVSCSWSKKTVGELRKQKWVWRSEEVEEIEVVNVDKDEDEEWPHFAVPQHLTEEH
ncbi:hypothetical protein ID866_10896 [Astraeus odoratus]|nr:hypothetical protein ID866_10896 [Astraeus odoratus]